MSTSPAAPRSLADALRAFDDNRLAALLTARPDLLHPVPSDMTALASRATTGPSVARALDALDALDLHVLGTAARLTAEAPAPAKAIVEAARDGVVAARPADRPARSTVEASLTRLVDRALLWGPPEALRSVHPVRDAIGTPPAPVWPPPAVHGTEPPVDPGEQAGIHALDALAMVDAVIALWGAEPPAVLRSGGLAVRDLARAMRELGEDAGATALWIELAAAAGLVVDDGEEAPHFMPSHDADRWLAQEPAARWARLARAWLTLPTLASTATERSNVLTADGEHRGIAALRRQALGVLAEAEGSLDAAGIVAILDFRHPRRAGALRGTVVEAVLTEGTRLGIIAAGTLTPPGRALAEPAPTRGTDPAARAMAACLPPLIDHVLVQADMTVIAPGPVVPPLARLLRLVADVESRGHATVSRISEASLRRAFDAGWDAASVLRSLREASSTPLPQSLEFLVADVARRHGSVRVGVASSYVRCDAPETVGAMLADRRLAGLGLVRVADTAVASTAPPEELLEALRGAGYAPAAESADGSVVMRPSAEHRAPAPARRAPVTVTRASDRLVDAAVRSLRSAERAAGAERGSVVAGPAGVTGAAASRPVSGAAAAAVLRAAIAATSPAWIAYADSDGTTTEQLVDPIRLGGGVLVAFDHRTETVRQFSVARISAVAEVQVPG